MNTLYLNLRFKSMVQINKKMIICLNIVTKYGVLTKRKLNRIKEKGLRLFKIINDRQIVHANKIF